MEKVWAFLKKYYEVIGYGILTLLLLGACFVAPFAWLAVIFTLALAGLLHNESKVFGLILYTHCFYRALKYPVVLGLTLDNALLGGLILIILGLYIYRLIKREYKLNYKLLIPIGLFLIYMALPFHQCTFYDFVAEVFFFALLYVIFEERKNIDLRFNVRVLVAGLLFACTFALLGKVSPVVDAKISHCYYYGILRFSGLSFHPNTLYGLIVMAITGMSVLYYQKKVSLIELLVSFTLLFGFAYFTLSRAFLVTSITGVVVFTVFATMKERGKGFIIGGAMLAIMCLVGGVFFGTTKAYFDRISKSTDLLIIDNNNANILIANKLNDEFDNQSEEWQQAVLNGEIDYDPGRPGIRQLYWRDWASSPKTVFFGRGISRPDIGKLPAHNLYLQQLWEHGIIGIGFYLAILICAINWKKAKQKILSCLPILIMLVPYLVEMMVESCQLDYARMGLVLSALGFFGQLDDDIKNNVKTKTKLSKER